MNALRRFHLDYLAWTLETHSFRGVRHTHALCDTIMLLAVLALLSRLPGPLGFVAPAALLALGFVAYVGFDAAASLLVAGTVAAGLLAARALDAVLPPWAALAAWAAVFALSVSGALLSHVFAGEKILLYPPSIVGARRVLAFAVYGGFLPLFGAYYQTTLFLVDLGGRATLAAEARRRVGSNLAPLV
jgi:hypothetical protein